MHCGMPPSAYESEAIREERERMPRLVEYPIDDTVEYILTNSSVGGRASDKARDAMSTLVECSVRSKTFKVKDMVQLLPGDTRSDDAIKTLKIKREGLNSLNAIDEAAVPEVISILNGYNAKAKNVQVVANNIRTGKVTVRGGVSEPSSHDSGISAPSDHDSENIPAEAVTEPFTGKDGDSAEKTADIVMTPDDVSTSEPAPALETADAAGSPLHGEEGAEGAESAEVEEAKATEPTEATAESDHDDADHKPLDAHETDGEADVHDNGNAEIGEAKLPDFEAMLKDDAGDGGMFSVDFDDDDDDELDDAGSDDEFGDDDGDDVNGYVDEDAPIDIDTDAYRRKFVPVDDDADSSTATAKEDVDAPETASDGTAESDGDDASANSVENAAHHDATDIDDAAASDEKPENADDLVVADAPVPTPATPGDAIDESIALDTDYGTTTETEDASSDTDTDTDTDTVTNNDTDTEEVPDASDTESLTSDSDGEPTDAIDAPQDGEPGEATESEDSDDGETNNGDDAGDGEMGEKPSEKDGVKPSPIDPNVDEIAVFKEVSDLHARIAGMKNPQQIQSEFEKLSPESKEALAKFANEQAKEALAKKEAPDTTGGLPEFARELEAEKAAAAAVVEKSDDEPVDDEVEKESGIGEPDIIGTAGEGIGTAGEGLEEPDCVSGGDIDYSDENPLVSAMLNKVYEGHGINSKPACVMLDVIFLVAMMVPFSGIINKYICGIDTFAFVGDSLFTFKSIGILALLFVVTRIISLTAQSRAYRKNVEGLDGKAERTAYRFYEPGIRAEFMFPSRSFGESIVRSVKSVIAGTVLVAATSLCVVDAPVAGMVLMAVSIVSIIFLGCRPLVDPEGYTDRMDLSDSTERRIESAVRSNKRKDCWMLSVLFMSFITCVALGSSMGTAISPIDMFLSPTLSVSIPGFTAFGLAGVLSIAHAFMVTIGMDKKPLSIFWTLIKSAVVLFAGLGIGMLFSMSGAFGMLALVLVAIASITFYFAGTSSCCKADLPLKRR